MKTRTLKLLGAAATGITTLYLLHRAGFLGLLIAASVGIIGALVLEDKRR